MIQEVLSVSENLYCLINNAAFVGTSEISGWNEPFKNQSLSSWRKALGGKFNIPILFITIF